jgi:hypothetical protein
MSDRPPLIGTDPKPDRTRADETTVNLHLVLLIQELNSVVGASSTESVIDSNYMDERSSLCGCR